MNQVLYSVICKDLIEMHNLLGSMEACACTNFHQKELNANRKKVTDAETNYIMYSHRLDDKISHIMAMMIADREKEKENG